MIVHHSPDLRTLYDSLGARMIAPESQSELEFAGTRLISLGNLLSADSCIHQFNLTKDGTGMLSRQRWTRLINDYIDKDSLSRWILELPLKPSSRSSPNRIIYYPFKETTHERHWRGKDPRHPNVSSGCLLTVAFSYYKRPVLSLTSRTVNWQIVGLDLSLMHCLARHIEEVHGLPTAETGFTWNVGTLAMTPIMTLPWLVVSGNIKKAMKPNAIPFLGQCRSLASRVFLNDEMPGGMKPTGVELKWARARRCRTWYNRYVADTHKSVPLESLYIFNPQEIQSLKEAKA